MILGGDVGGTKTNVGLFEMARGVPVPVRRATYRSSEHPGLLPILVDFLGGSAREVEGACIGIAGPVAENRCRTPNLPWEVSGDGVARDLGLPFLSLVNDLQATALGISALAREDLTVVQAGRKQAGGAAALIAAGTGLGMCILAPGEGGDLPLPSEGGHASFSPRDEEEEALRRHLAARFGHVSRERVVSGPGLLNIYEFLRDTGREAAFAAVEEADGDPTPVISREALASGAPICGRALSMFLSAYGAAAGDLALTALARGGLFVGGGIAPRLLPRLLDGEFVEGFLAKGRFRALLEEVPVLVIENPETAMLGAARQAARLARRR